MSTKASNSKKTPLRVQTGNDGKRRDKSNSIKKLKAASFAS